jgi:hypothetical protein
MLSKSRMVKRKKVVRKKTSSKRVKAKPSSKRKVASKRPVRRIQNNRVVRTKKVSKAPVKNWGWKAQPANAGFLVMSIIGFLVSGYLIFPLYIQFGFAFMVVFALMFSASVISMVKASIPEGEGL